MKILIISTLSADTFGGSEQLWIHLTSAALEKGHSVTAAIHPKRTYPEKIQRLIQKGLKLHILAFKQSNNRLLNTFFHLLRKYSPAFVNPYKVLMKYKPDIIFVAQAGSVDAARNRKLRDFLLSTGLPYYLNPQQIGEIDALPDPIHWDSVRTVHKRAEAVLFVSRRNLEVFHKTWLIQAGPSSIVVKNPISILPIAYTPPPEGNKVKMAFVAALTCKQKGQHLLIEVLADDVWKARDWELSLYGSGQDQAYLKKLIQYYQLEDRIFLRGYAQDVPQIWATHHIHVFPTYSEGMPLALLESLACGRTAVATDIGGITEWVQDGVNGFIAPAPTPYLIHDALERAWKHKEEWEEMGKRSKELIESAYQRDSSLEILEILEKS